MCTNASNRAPLSVLALPPIPVLDRVYSFCYSGLPGDEKIVLDLKNAIGRSDINIYNDELGGGVLNDIDLLVDGEDYYVSAFNSSGGESVIRSLTNVVIASPEIVMSASTGAICLGDSVTLTAKGVPKQLQSLKIILIILLKKLLPMVDHITSLKRTQCLGLQPKV